MTKRNFSRRGFTLVETIVASSILLTVMIAVSVILMSASRSFDQTARQTDADQTAVLTMRKLTAELREAQEVYVLGPGRLKIVYPSVVADGYYNRFQPNVSEPVYLEQTDATGTYQPDGEYIWKRTGGGDAGAALVKGIKLFRASNDAPQSLQLTVVVSRGHGERVSEARLDQRVLYLRNH